MRYSLENDQLKIEIDSFGAELKSVVSKETGKDFLWYADSKYWGRTSPVLFPFVGSLKNKEFFVGDKAYPMGQHGFARDMEFSLKSQEPDCIWFALSSTEETLAKYPFAFTLEIGYKLDGNNVSVLWRVTNTDTQTMPFSIGAHPAFLCPVNNDTDKTGYRISFGKFADGAKDFAKLVACTEIHHHGNTRDTGLAITEDIVLPLENGSVEITDGFFDRCTYMIEGNQANSVGLIDASGKEYVTVLFDTPLFAIWSPEEKNAPFVCIEPWYGRCDHVDFTGDIFAREFTNKLAASEVFDAKYIMQFHA